MRIIKFNWDNAKGDDHNGNHLIIGQHLDKQQNDDLTHCEVYGVSLDIVDTYKDYQLKRHCCYMGNIVGDVVEISKEEARTLMIQEIDKVLDVMFDSTEMNAVDKSLNVHQ